MAVAHIAEDEQAILPPLRYDRTDPGGAAAWRSSYHPGG